MIVRFEKVSKDIRDHGKVIHALKEASFVIEESEFVAIIGPSGSGKSTLLTLMGALQKPSSGEIYFKDRALSSLSDIERQKLRFDNIGFVLQESNLLPYLNLLEQLRLVDKVRGVQFNKDRAVNLLERFGLGEYKKSYPADLSGGERQRAAICRAIYPDPDIILADEPTANLDSSLAFTVAEILQKSSKQDKKAILMVTHDERLLKYVDRVFEILDGELKER